MKINNIFKLGLINFFSALYFYLPITTLWYQSRGLSLMEVGTLNGIITITIFFTTIFTGMFADRFGRKKAIIASLLFQLLGEMLFLTGNSFLLFVLCYISAGLGFSFWSGAFDSIMIESLKEKGQESQVQKVSGNISAFKGFSTILGAGASSVIISSLDQSRFVIAILMTIGSVATALFISLFLKEPKLQEKHVVSNPKDLLVKSVAILKTNNKLRRIVLLAILTTPFTSYLTSFYQPYFVNLGVKGYWFGIAYAIGGFLAILASKSAYLIATKLGDKKALLLFTILPGALFVLMALNNFAWLAIILFCLNYGSAVFQGPLFVDYTNRHISSENRATVLSFIGMLASLYIAIMGPIIGKIADFSVPSAFIFMGSIIIFAAIFLRIDENHLTT
jgi:MFS family permease